MNALQHKLAEGFIHEMMKHADTTVAAIPVEKNWFQQKGDQINNWAKEQAAKVLPHAAKWMGPEAVGKAGKEWLDQNKDQRDKFFGDHIKSDEGQRDILNKGFNENIRGAFKPGPGGITINPAGIPGVIGGWIKNNPGTALMGGGALLGGGMLLSSMFSGNNNNQQQGQPQSITPQGYQPPKTTFNKFSVANDEDIRQYVLNSIYDSN